MSAPRPCYVTSGATAASPVGRLGLGAAGTRTDCGQMLGGLTAYVAHREGMPWQLTAKYADRHHERAIRPSPP